MKVARKKFVKTTIFFAAILLPGNFCLGSRGELSVKKANAELYVRTHISKVQEEGSRQLIDVNDLYQIMVKDPTLYSNRKIAWDELQKEKTKSFISWYENEITVALKTVGEDYFVEKEKKDFLICPEKIVSSYLVNNFAKSADIQGTVFAKAREKACADQFKKLIGDIYPGEVEFDDAFIKDQLNNLRAKILDQLVKRQKEPIFSENVNILGSNFVDPILADAKAQLEKQGSMVADSSGASYVVPEDIADFIKNEIVQYQNQLRKEKQEEKIINKVYGVFPSVSSKIADRSNEIAIKRFRDSVADITLPIDKDTLRKLMEISLSNHSNKNQSWDNCLKSFHDTIANKAIDVHTAKAPPDKRTAFRQFLSSLIFNSNQSCKDAVNGLVEKSLRDSFDSIRKEISEEQFKDFFQPLESKTWKPSEDEIDSWYNRSSLSIFQPLKMPGISSKSFDSSALFEETVELVLKAEQSAIGKGLSALREQMSTVQGLEAQMEREIAASSAGPPLLDKVIQSYTEKVKTAWSSSGFSKDYPNLFKRTEKDIDMRSRKVLDAEIKRQKDVQARSQVQDSGRSKTLSSGGGTGSNTDGGESKGPGGGGAGTGGGIGGGKGPGKEEQEPGDEMPDVILDFGYENGKVYADIMFPKESKDKLRLSIDPDVNLKSSSMSFATTLFATWLKRVSESAKKDQQEINVYVLARVFSGNSVLYSMVYYFRECLILALQRVGNERIKIHWYDKLFDEPDDIEKYRGKPVLPPSFKKGNMSTLWT